VNNRKAKPASSIDEIRKVLGVRASDNLRHADLVLLVEGEDDATALRALLSDGDALLRKALEAGILVIDNLHGASNLAYQVGLVRSALCLVYCFLDNDQAGHRAFDGCKKERLLTEADVNFSNVRGLSESEFEDMLDVRCYEQMILTDYRVQVSCPAFKSNKKWSDRLREAFTLQGKPWSDNLEAEVKLKVANLVARFPNSALHPQRRSSFDTLMQSLAGLISSMTVPSNNHKENSVDLE
jgi:hypothetical protein